MSLISTTATLWIADVIYILVKKLKVPKNFAEYLAEKLESKVAIGGIAVLTSVLVLLGFNSVYGTDPFGRTRQLFTKFSKQEKTRNIKVDKWIDTYNNLHDDSKAGLGERNSSYTTLVNAYYELATSFYEWGWGESFHFAYQFKHETFQSAIARHEYYIAGRLGVKAGDKVLDCGCGIGGPMRNIARLYIHHV